MLTSAERAMLTELDESEKAIAGGDWTIHNGTCLYRDCLFIKMRSINGRGLVCKVYPNQYGNPNRVRAAFIALSRNTARPLIELVRRLEAENARLRAVQETPIDPTPTEM